MDGTILTANENFLKAMGYSLAEVQGEHHSMFVDPSYKLSDEFLKFWEALRRGEFRLAEFRRLVRNDHEVWIEASYNPILGADGKPYKVIKFGTDVTAQTKQFADLSGKVNAISRSQAVIEFNLD